MVYAEMRKRNVSPGSVVANVPYGEKFKEVSIEMYGRTAEGCALYLARKRSQAEGNYIYAKSWVWNEYNPCLSDITKKGTSIASRTANFYRLAPTSRTISCSASYFRRRPERSNYEETYA